MTIFCIFLIFLPTISRQAYLNEERQCEFDGVDLLKALGPVQYNLTQLLFENGPYKYDKEVSPIPQDHHFRLLKPWEYSIEFIRLKLIDVDEPKEQMMIVAEITQEWYDPRLEWKSEEHGNIETMYWRLEKVWSPPFVVYTASEVVEFRDQNFRMVKVFHSGSLKAHIPLKITTNCKLNMTNFPFDHQICEIRAGIPTMDSHIYKLITSLRPSLLEFCENVGNSAWEIVNITAGTEEAYGYDLEGINVQVAVLKLHLKRNPVYYLYMIVLPSFIINSISIAGVFLKNTNKMERLTVGLTHIMTMTFILGIIADKLPKTEDVPLLGKFVIFSLFIMICAMTVSTYLKRISGFVGGKLKGVRSAFGQTLRKFFGQPLRLIFIVIFQSINILSILYLIWRWYHFSLENRVQKSEYCWDRGEKSMEIKTFETIVSSYSEQPAVDCSASFAGSGENSGVGEIIDGSGFSGEMSGEGSGFF